MRQTTSLISCRFKKEMTLKVCSIFLELNKFKDVKMGQRENLRRMLVEISFERERMLCWSFYLPSLKEAFWMLPFASNIVGGGLHWVHSESVEICFLPLGDRRLGSDPYTREFYQAYVGWSLFSTNQWCCYWDP